MRSLAVSIRVVGAFVIGAAVVAQMLRTVQNEAAGAGHVGYVVLNFFSFFTVESNVIAVAVLALGAAVVIGVVKEPAWFATVRAAVTTYMVVTGIVYNVLLRGIELPQGATVGWSNEILHVVGPVIMLLDWLLFANQKRLSLRSLGWIVSFPIVWSAYTLLRGVLQSDPRSGGVWYPYPFLNPEVSPGGYLFVTIYVVLIAALIGAVGVLILKYGGINRVTHAELEKVPV